MKKIGVIAFAVLVSAGLRAQDGRSFASRMAERNVLSHVDVGVSVGTMGIGAEVAVPVGDYVRVRAGYHYMPRFTINSNFPVATRSGGGSVMDYIGDATSISDLQGRIASIERRLGQMGVDISSPEYAKTKALFDYYGGMSPDERATLEVSDKVSMGLRPSMHQFKLLVDVLPFRNNKHWSLTAGIFAGPAVVGDACNRLGETLALMTISSYNELYTLSLRGELPNGNHITSLEDRGVAGFNLGHFRDGRLAIMVPDEKSEARAEMEVSKVRPYIGLGYNTHLSRNRRWLMNVDAGVMFLCGAPSVYVDNVYAIDESKIDPADEMYDIVRPNDDWTDYVVDEPLQHVDLVHDLQGIPGKVGDLVDVVSKFKVYPNATVTFSYRLF